VCKSLSQSGGEHTYDKIRSFCLGELLTFSTVTHCTANTTTNAEGAQVEYASSELRTRDSTDSEENVLTSQLDHDAGSEMLSHGRYVCTYERTCVSDSNYMYTCL